MGRGGVPRLVLFDVDGTLLTAQGAGRRALARALRLVYGTDGPIDGYDFRGKTDPWIVADLMAAAGLPSAQVRQGLPECFEAYVRALSEEIAPGGVVTLPGVPGLVRRLAETDGVVLGLVTGNVEPAAWMKLELTGLRPHFRTGAFGSDHADRRRLPPLAARRAHALVGRRFSPEQVVIVGDTPLDIDCARAFGAAAVAVATGHYPRAELEACAPDLLFDDFADVDRAAVMLLGHTPGASPAGAPVG
jgi:phosphoglycolate phosphatase